MSSAAQFPPVAAPAEAEARARDGALLGWMQVAPFGILTTDTSLRILGWNRWLATHSGLAEATVLGRGLFELFPDITERGLEGPFRRALLGETAVLSTALHQYLLPLPPGSRDLGVSRMRQTARVAPLHAEGGIVGTISILEDVTQRECQARILRRQQEHDRLLSTSLALLLESSRPLDAVAELFPSIAVPLKLDLFLNHLVAPDTLELQLRAAAGVPAEVRRALAHLPLDGGQACAQCARAREAMILPRLQATEELRVEPFRRLGLRSLVIFPLVLGERLLGTLAFGSYARDFMAEDELSFLRTLSQYLAVTIDRAQRDQALREAQTALSRHAELLETTVAERTVRLRETIEELEGFSYTVAHDLRAPIRWIAGYTELLLHDHGEHIPTGARFIVERLRNAGLRLEALTRDLLSFSRVARQEVALEPVDVASVLADVVALSPGLPDGTVWLDEGLGRVMAQRTLLQQCLANLFDNALKFAKPGEPARIVVRAERFAGAGEPGAKEKEETGSRGEQSGPGERGKTRVRLWVEDCGIGIAPEAQRKIFGIFERASGLEHIAGTGIGLAIVTRAMQRMGGACGVESEAGAGARFWLELAAAPE